MEDNTMNESLHFESRLDMSRLHEKIEAIKGEISRVIVGQEKLVDMLLISLLANGHTILEGVPGVAKTITAKLLSKCIQTDFSRIQFTPDLMPSDILGTLVFDVKKADFEYRKGPIFANVVLIDEINRAPAKTQAALFEVMEERQITMDGTTYPMELPFLVVATQNPIEQEGTYRLPEAQLDRFLIKIQIDYPAKDEEIEIITRENNLYSGSKLDDISPVISSNEIMEFQSLVRQVKVDPQMITYIAGIVVSTRQNPMLYLGASPRASIAILNASKAHAAIRGRDFVTPDDIKEVAYAVLNHRLIVSPEKEMEGITTSLIIKQILESVEIPR
ncbi:MAG: MoxR family ATPase [Saprospiraceae bacterium]|jgi:MoxR-like ATPase|nr:MoxR family ATPase [Saprospiraceae bacterium]